jgi:hypothetical protein
MKKLNEHDGVDPAESGGEQNVARLNTEEGEVNSSELAQLRAMVSTLKTAVDTSAIQQAKASAFNEVLSEVKSAARLVSAMAGTTASYSHPAMAENYPKDHGCGCSEKTPKGRDCECTSANCCTFEIILTKVRASRPQIEPPDIGDIPLLTNALEVQMYVTVDGFGVLIPGLATTMDLRANGLPPGPGPWVTMNRVVGRVTVTQGMPKAVQFCAEVAEIDAGIERPIAFKDEYGEACGQLVLDCCIETIYPSMPLEVDLIHGGEGRGSVTLAFMARRVCG